MHPEGRIYSADLVELDPGNTVTVFVHTSYPIDLDQVMKITQDPWDVDPKYVNGGPIVKQAMRAFLGEESDIQSSTTMLSVTPAPELRSGAQE